MTTIERRTATAASPDEIWSVLADFAGISAWAPNVDHAELMSEQAEGVGMKRRIQTGRTTLVETVTDWEPATKLSYAITGLPPVITSVTNTWQIEASGTGSTVRLTTDVEAGARPPQKAIAKAVGRRLGAASDEMIAGLTSYMNGRRSVTKGTSS